MLLACFVLRFAPFWRFLLLSQDGVVVLFVWAKQICIGLGFLCPLGPSSYRANKCTLKQNTRN